MHTLLVIVIVLLALIALFLGILAFIILQAFFAVQPILAQLGKISMVIEGIRFVRKRWSKKKHSEEPESKDKTP